MKERGVVGPPGFEPGTSRSLTLLCPVISRAPASALLARSSQARPRARRWGEQRIIKVLLSRSPARLVRRGLKGFAEREPRKTLEMYPHNVYNAPENPGAAAAKAGRRGVGMLGEDPELLRAKLEELRARLKASESEAVELKNGRDALNAEVKEISSQIRQILSEYNTIKSEYLNLKKQKEELYNEVQKLKSERDRVREDLKALREEVNMLLNELKNLQAAIGKRKINVFELKERLEQLEWEYQTRTMDPEEEKNFVERIRDTESLLRMAERYNECLSQIKMLRQLISEKRKIHKDLTDSIKKISNQYLEVKAQLKSLRDKVNEMRAKLSELIEKKEALRRKADEYHSKYVAKVNEIKQLREEIERTALMLKAAELSRVLSRRRAELYEVALKALEKYKQGEKLSLDEFKLLMEFNLIEHGAASGSA